MRGLTEMLKVGVAVIGGQCVGKHMCPSTSLEQSCLVSSMRLLRISQNRLSICLFAAFHSLTISMHICHMARTPAGCLRLAVVLCRLVRIVH